MKLSGRLLTRVFVLSVVAILIIAGHTAIFSYVLARVGLSGAIAFGALAVVMILVVIAHRGMFGSLFAALRRR
jgi:hypothetical protein